MEKAFDFLSSHKDVAFATVEQNKPKIRVFQIMKQEGHTLYFATSPHKEVYRQLQENSNIELLAMDNNISVRVTGCAVFDVPDEVAREIYENNPVLPRLYKQYTDLAYSIVPTIFSYDGIPEVIDFAEKNGIFPSIGELENAGNVYRKGIKDVLDVNSEDLLNLKKLADNYSNGDYKRPICSAILTGIHIDNMGDCIVDRTSGLNCKWFLLTEPDVYKIGNIRNISVKHLFDKVNEYRKQQFTKNNNLFKKYIEEEVVFGGCGGNIKEVFKLAIELNG